MARYIPGNVADAAISDELQKIAQALDTPNQMLMLDTLYAEPTKFREGALVLADGDLWKPDGSATPGAYIYYGAAWHFLG